MLYGLLFPIDILFAAACAAAERMACCHRRLTAVLCLAWGGNSQAGTWVPMATAPPGTPNVLLLLSDGRVMMQDGSSTGWFCLQPNIYGSYTSGTWTRLASMNDTRQYYSQQILRDGRVFVAGGEQGSGGSTAEVYAPLKNTWTALPSAGQKFGDSVSTVLPNGTVLVAPANMTGTTMIYDPAGNNWAQGPTTLRSQDEVPWLKLPDASILCVDGSSQSERYIPSLNQWVADANTLVSLYGRGETGSGHMLANGSAFFRGYTHTAIYTPSGGIGLGTWSAGPDVPNGLNCGDTPGAVMITGNVLFAAGADYLTGPTSFFEYNPGQNQMTQINGPTGLTNSNNPYAMKMLNLPDGGILLTTGDTLYEYFPTGATVTSLQPTILGITQNADGSYHLTGTQLNGFSEGASYGDDFQMATNYPMIRLVNTIGQNCFVYYARSYNWSSTGVQTGSATVSTEFTLPPTLPAGTYSLAVVANGIASNAVTWSTPYTTGLAALQLATPATTTALPTTTLTSRLSVLGASNVYQESSLTYTWTLVNGPSGSSIPPLFSTNYSNAAKSISVTTYASGTYTFAVTIEDPGGGTATSSVNLNIALSPIDQWRVQCFGTNAANAAISGILVDNDADGLVNLLEYAFNSDPLAVSPGVQPYAVLDGSSLSLLYRQNDAATDLLYSVQQSSNLSNWTTSAANNSTLTDDGTTRLIKANIPLGSASGFMLRLRVALP